MEAIGQLTGGVAHDFNNLLSVIVGNLELAGDGVRPGTPTARFIGNAVTASQRGAALTQRLLAFSRKQPLEPRTVDAHSLVFGMSDLLRRTLGEPIELQVVGDGGLWMCRVDPAQLENAVLNLAINARDAMLRGGKLTIETSNAHLDDVYAASHAEVRPGQYVLVAVTDTGMGMSKEVRRRVFEPFFTTKGAGRGSGLGLSMVYGFVKQSGGHVSIYSEIGEGTTIKMYLPRESGRADPLPDADEHSVIMGRGETILVVEDDADVRVLVVNMLLDLGYEVLQAGSGREAMACVYGKDGIDLMLTDIVLPGGMNGRELAHAAGRRRRGLPTLFMSGYTENAVIHHGRLDEGVSLLQKPFRRRDLAHKVREVIDQGQRPPATESRVGTD